MYITFYSRNAREAFRFEALELNAMKEKPERIFNLFDISRAIDLTCVERARVSIDII